MGTGNTPLHRFKCRYEIFYIITYKTSATVFKNNDAMTVNFRFNNNSAITSDYNTSFHSDTLDSGSVVMVFPTEFPSMTIMF